MLLEKLAIEPAGGAEVVGLIVITIGAIRRAGGTDKMKVRDALETTSGYIGTGGKVTMSASDHMGLDLTAFRMLEVRNGDWVLLN
jgi:branched-chain amino acid transport system substrate-binding protein